LNTYKIIVNVVRSPTYFSGVETEPHGWLSLHKQFATNSVEHIP